MTTDYIFSDLNVRDKFVSPSTETMLYDTKVIVQSVWRLLTTQEGEIPNFREYGLDIKQFLQYPLTNDTVNLIYNYVKGKITYFEDRAEVLQANVSVDFETGLLNMVFTLRVKSTGDVFSLPTWTVQVSTS